MADVVVTLSGDEVALLKSLQKIIDQQKKVDESLDKTKKKSQDAGDSAKKSAGLFGQMGDQARSALDPGQITGYVTGLASISTAINAAIKVWDNYKKAQEDAVNSLEKLRDPDQKLAQVAGPGQLPSLFNQADQISVARGIGREQSRDLLFSAISDGYFNEVDRVARASNVVKMEEAGIVAGQSRGLFKNDPTTVDEALSMTLTAAKVSRLDFGPMAKALPNAAEGAAQINSTMAETLATQAVLAGVFKTGDVAADRIKGFASRAALDPATKNKGLLGAFDYVSALPEAERKDWLGTDQEKNAVFNALTQNIAQIRDVEKQILADRAAVGRGGGLLNERIEETNRVPQIRSRMMLESSRIAAEIAQEKRFAETGVNAEITENDVKRMLDETNAGVVRRTAVGWMSPVWTQIGLDAQSQMNLAQVALPTDWNPGNFMPQAMQVDALTGQGMFTPTPQVQTTQQLIENMQSASAAAGELRDNLRGAADAAKVQAARSQAAVATQP